MLKIEVIIKQFQKAVQRLDEVLQEKKTNIVRDSAIQRFEFTFDLAWKTIKAFLEDNQGLSCLSPKDCFKEAFRQKLIDYEDIWLDVLSLRNKTVHTYNEKLAEEVYSHLFKILPYFQKLLEKIKSRI
ncbi:MAG TPA: DUF86 domain-containing protein [Candidatus Wolfebacteria bacterium]|nr:DUF86 domain-containing protein [Candidatus Wolfebacteria bacterium]